MRFESLKIPLEVITSSKEFRLLSLRPYNKYEGQKKTDEVIGHRYTVGDAATFDQLDIKVPGPALIQPEQLATAKAPIDVQFANCTARPYRSSNGNYELSFTADSIRIAKQ